MVSTAYINIWGIRAGAVAWNKDMGIGAFEYAPDFVRHNLDLSPVQMPIIAKARVFSFLELRSVSTFKGMPGLLADLLPDRYGNALINSWLARYGRATDSLNPVEMLCFIGQRGMGALEIEPAIPEGNEVFDVELSDLVQVSEQILTNRINFKSKLSAKYEKSLTDILKIGTSAGGARAKAIIAFNDKTNVVKSGQASVPEGFSHWLIKFDGVSDKQFGASSGYGRVEMAYYLMAKACGIEMMECRLLEEHGRAHFMTRRFDRTFDNEKLHVQTFCAIRHFDFNLIGAYSYEQLFETMRMLRLSYPEAEQMYRRMVFNVIARNCDDHTKNFAFLMDRNGKWRLAPAYDVCHAYRPGSDWVSQHALSVNGKRTLITKDDLLTIAYQMNIKRAKLIIEQINEQVQHWSSFAKEVDVNKELVQAIQLTLNPL